MSMERLNTTCIIFGQTGDHLGLRDRIPLFCQKILFHLFDFLSFTKTFDCPNNKLKLIKMTGYH
ncbi:hypothetical protein MAR_016091 [Mya arenaria]|uniref:Uncharacterized protein n=1 Tax=Mya arenaria TaxID=6604 RepID=A0ABY7FJ04_MYAAR|nr:hypothetical protein MAR_016091 [Mya arenaria]